MRIGIDARMYGPQQTGIGNYIKYLIRYLEQIDTRNEYIIFLRDPEYAELSFKNPRFSKRLAHIPWYSFSEQTVFLKLLLDASLDIAHFPHFNVPMFYRKPFITTIHDLTPKRFPGEKVGKSLLSRLGYSTTLGHAVKGAQAIIAPSQVTREDILTSFPRVASRAHVIYEGIPLPPSSSKRPVIEGPYVLYVGVWRSHKNLPTLLRAFALLKSKGIPHTLVLVGEPDIYYAPTKALWESLGLSNNVVATGFQKETELAAWYRHASLLVLPSFSEGFGLTPLVALSLGVPVAVSDIPVLREILQESASYFDPGDAGHMAQIIHKSLQHKTIRTAQLSHARHLLPRYSWEEMAKKTLALFEAHKE